MHLDNFSGLPRNNIVQLTCEVLGWEAEVLGEDHMPQDILTIGSFDRVLVLTGQLLVYSSGFKVEEFVHVVVKFEELPSHYVDLHDNCIGDLVGLFQVVLFRYFCLDWL